MIFNVFNGHKYFIHSFSQKKEKKNKKNILSENNSSKERKNSQNLEYRVI